MSQTVSDRFSMRMLKMVGRLSISYFGGWGLINTFYLPPVSLTQTHKDTLNMLKKNNKALNKIKKPKKKQRKKKKISTLQNSIAQHWNSFRRQ